MGSDLPSSDDLDVVDSSTWSILEENASAKSLHSLESFTVTEWKLEIVRNACRPSLGMWSTPLGPKEVGPCESCWMLLCDVSQSE